jgi:hypothetical protein
LLRLFDLTENLKRDRLMVAFVAEFSRGKTELINALFFSDFKQRLLPSDAGRTTMCPTEIYYDAIPNRTSACCRSRPVSATTASRPETAARSSGARSSWSVKDPNAMVTAMRKLAETKVVFKVEARALGLWDENDPNLGYMVKDQDRVEIPAWRYCHDQLPPSAARVGPGHSRHPRPQRHGRRAGTDHLLDPQRPRPLVPARHRHRRDPVRLRDLEQMGLAHASQHYAVLNKIDMLWDDLKTPEEIGRTIQRQIESTATQLNIAPVQRHGHFGAEGSGGQDSRRRRICSSVPAFRPWKSCWRGRSSPRGKRSCGNPSPARWGRS